MTGVDSGVKGDGGRPRGGTVCLDFDGVLHAYTRGWDDGTIYDPPVPGAVAAVRSIVEAGYKVVVCTCREPVEDVQVWLSRNFRLTLEVTNRKPAAFIYIDDRALRFEGSWADTLNELAAVVLNEGRAPLGNGGS